MLVAALTLSVVAAAIPSAASALKYEWSVNKTPLASGSSEEFTTKLPSGGKITFVTKFGGEKLELSAAQVKVKSGAIIKGGLPGTGEESLTFEKVSVVKPKECVVVGQRIATEPLKATIVQAASGGVGSGQTAILLKNKSGEVPFVLSFENEVGGTCALGGVRGSVSGDFLAKLTQSEVNPQTLTFGGGQEYIPSGGSATTAGLKFGGIAFTIEGATEMELLTKSPFAAL